MPRPPKSESALPWERQPGEGDKAFAAFCAYRDMGPSRSTRKVAASLSKSNALIMQWSRDHGWVERAGAFDDDQDRISREARNQEIEKMRKRHADIGQALIAKAGRALLRIEDSKVRPADVARMVEVGSKLERVSRGEPETITENRTAEGAGPDHGTLGELATDSGFLGAIQAALASGQGEDPRYSGT